MEGGERMKIERNCLLCGTIIQIKISLFTYIKNWAKFRPRNRGFFCSEKCGLTYGESYDRIRKNMDYLGLQIRRELNNCEIKQMEERE